MTAVDALADDGWLSGVRRIPSPNVDERPPGVAICLVVIHAISLPPGEFGGNGIIELFTNTLNPEAHPYYRDIANLRVSAHFLIRRDGELIQFASVNRRAWHAGASWWAGREHCNDFSIGIELEGNDDQIFEDIQYQILNALLLMLMQHYPLREIVGHSTISPGRKIDPGPCFDWTRIMKPRNIRKI